MLTLAISMFIFGLPIAISPGPGNIFFIANAVRFGFWRVLPANIGYHVAMFATTLLVGLGLGTVLNAYPKILIALRILGGAYILWLAYKIAFSKNDISVDKAANACPTFWDGFILLVLNPKGYAVMLLYHSQFSSDNSYGIMGFATLVAMMFTITNATAFLPYTALASKIGRFIATPARVIWMNRTLGALLALVALWIMIF